MNTASARPIAEIEADLAVATDAVRALRMELDAARLSVLPVSVGDVATNRSGETFLVTEIKPWGSGSGWVRGRMRRRDGSWGAALRNVGTVDEIVRYGSAGTDEQDETP